MAAAARFFSQKLDKQVSETTVHSIKNVYVEQLGVKRRSEGESTDDVSSLPVACGRQFLTWSSVGLESAAVSQEGPRRWRSNICQDCDGSSSRHSTQV